MHNKTILILKFAFLAIFPAAHLCAAELNEQQILDIQGADENHNFVRDDVEKAIREKYAQRPEIISAALYYASVLEKSLLAETPQEVAEGRAERVLASTCLVDAAKDVSAAQKVKQFITLKVINTRERSKAMDRSQKLTRGYVQPLIGDYDCPRIE